MGFFTFLNPDAAFRVPDMDSNTALRRILQLLNDATPAGQTGSTNSVGATFKTLNDVIVNTANVAKQCEGAVSPRGVLVVASSGNTSSIYVGDSSVTSSNGSKRGIELTPAGMSSVVIPVSNANQIFINTDTANNRASVSVL